MSNYEKAKSIAQKIVNLEIKRKTITMQEKILKEELQEILLNNNIVTCFEFENGLCFLDKTINYKVCDGLKEEVTATSNKPDELSQDFIESYFKTDLKLTKRAKEAIAERDVDLLAVLVPEEKQKIVVKTVEIIEEQQEENN